MKWVRTVLMVGLIGAFALATNHCRLEVLSGLEFLICCSHEAGAAPHQDDDCETDACATLEAALYKSEDGHVTSLVPLSDDVDQLPPLLQHIPFSGFCANFATVAPPELSASWHFLLRVASPPRAPSLAS